MWDRLRERFRARFGREPELGARAPGRVNLIGEHTDYGEGLVLPCAIDRATAVLAAPRSDARVRVISEGFAGAAEFDARAPARRGDWVDYVQGPFAVLRARGAALPGLDLAVASDVPRESGLSSSAALEVAVAWLLGEAAGLGLAPRDVAALAHRAENDFVGVACGIMDPYASALGRAGCALRIDCRSLEVEPIPIGGAALALLVVHSGVRRQLASGGYARRVAECGAALAQARAAGVAPAARALRDLVPEQLPALERALEAVPFRRARHVITENARVDAFAAALRAGDLAAAGALLRAGMQSLRRDFEVSTPELDLLCEAADAQPGCHGSRLTGAGWGGCTLHLVAPGAAEAVAAATAAAFEARFGRRPPSWLVTPADGAGSYDPHPGPPAVRGRSRRGRRREGSRP
jgi:galactokinase